MTTVEYLSLSKAKQFRHKLGNFFIGIPLGIGRFFKSLPKRFLGLLKKLLNPLYLLKDAFVYSDWKVRLTYLICGFGLFTRKQKVKGICCFAYEAIFIVYMVLIGGTTLSLLPTFGYVAGVESLDPVYGIMAWTYHDNSFSTLLYSIVTIALMIVMVFVWYTSIKASKLCYEEELIGKGKSTYGLFESIVSKHYHTVLLTIPMAGVIVFTIIPIIFMILIGFTNYNSYHQSPNRLFDWVGLNNYGNIFSSGDTASPIFLTTFLQVLAWTLIWAFFATFSNYFLGMIVALMINRKGIKLKKLWRTILITTIAVPQFVSLLLIQRMLNQDLGIINQWIGSPIPWLKDPWITKVVIIVVNTWIGIPYTMLICTGILMNIPEDLYESAKIDGASPTRMFLKITLPYMLFITAPYLISQFVGNINNFNVIYLLSEGNPAFTFSGITKPQTLEGVGQTDLLITWIYKMTMTNNYKNYGTASVLGVFIFAIVAFFSLIFYGRSKSVKNEEDFQ